MESTGSHADADIESNVAKVLKIIKNNGQDKKGKVLEDSKKRSELIGLIEEIHKQYQSLHAQYDHLKGEMGKKARGRKGRDTSSKDSSSSSSSSDSEYYSSEEKDKFPLKNERRDGANSSKEESENATSKHKKQQTIKEDLKQKQDEPKRELSALVKVHDIQGSQASAQIKELEGQLTTLRIEMESLRGLNKDLGMQVENKASEAKQIGRINLQLQARISDLELQAKDKADELSAITTKLKDKEKTLTSQIKNLEDQVSNLESEVEFLQDAKYKTEASQSSEVSALIKGLKDRVFVMQQEMDTISSQKTDLESQLEIRTEEVSENRVKMETLEDEIARETKSANEWRKEKEGLLVKNKEFKLELQSLKNQRRELEELVRGRNLEIDKLKEEKERLAVKNEELKPELQSLNNKKNELEELVRGKHHDADKLREEKERLNLMNDELKLDLQSLRNEKYKLDELLRNKNHEKDKLKEEKERLNARISELERSLSKGRDELSNLQKKNGDETSKASAELTALKAQVKGLQQKIDSLLDKKRVLEMKNEQLKLDLEEKQSEAQREIHNLTDKIVEQQKMLKEKEETVKKFSEEHKLVKHLSLDPPKQKQSDSSKYRLSDAPRINHQSLERKIEELAEKFQMKMENHIRLLYQRILVAEQIHSETKDSYKKIKERLEQENEDLNEKLTLFESAVWNFKDLFSEPEKDVCPGEDVTAKRQDVDNTELLNRIGNILSEIQSAKNWVVEKNNEIKEKKQNLDSLTMQLDQKEEQELLSREKLLKLEEELHNGSEIKALKHDVDTLTAQLDQYKEKESLLRENLHKLEEELQNEGGGNRARALIRLEYRVEYLEHQLKENQELLLEIAEEKLAIEEEKREAIRQLCVLIDYHKSRNDHLKMVVSKMAGKTRRPA